MDDKFLIKLGYGEFDSWKKCTSKEEQVKHSCFKTLKGRLNNGISVWEYRPDKVMRIIAMLTYKSRETSPRYVIYRDKIFIPNPNNANTIATDINHLHCDYINLSDDELIELVNLIVEGRENTASESDLLPHWNEFDSMNE